MVNFRRDNYEALASFRAGRNRNKPTGGVSFLFSVSLYQKLSQVTHQPYEPKGRENVRKKKKKKKTSERTSERETDRKKRERETLALYNPSKEKKKERKEKSQED